MLILLTLSLLFLPAACSFSFMLASEALLTLESIATSIMKFNDKLMQRNNKSTSMGSIEAVLPGLRSRLSTSSQKILMHNWDNENSENSVKSKVRPSMLCFQPVAFYIILVLIAILVLLPELGILLPKNCNFFSGRNNAEDIASIPGE